MPNVDIVRIELVLRLSVSYRTISYSSCVALSGVSPEPRLSSDHGRDPVTLCERDVMEDVVAVPNRPLMYAAYRKFVRYGTGIDVVPNLRKCPVPVLMYRTYRSVRYRY